LLNRAEQPESRSARRYFRGRDSFAILTTAASNVVRPTKAMLLPLSNPEEGDTWFVGSAEEASGEGREERLGFLFFFVC
jgi:hypothetical protein